MLSGKEGFDESDEQDEMDEDESGITSTDFIKSYVRMWPRAVFWEPGERGPEDKGRSKSAADCKELNDYGVYILYRDDAPFYVGKAIKRTLYRRMRSHALNPRGKRYLFWNYFSAFIVPVKHIDEVEALLISAMPSVLANDAAPRLKRSPLPKAVSKILRQQMRSTV